MKPSSPSMNQRSRCARFPELKSADLAYRGFSRGLPVPGKFAANVRRVGRRTPHGRPCAAVSRGTVPCRELLTEGDDQMVVLAAGDAITVRFEVPADPVPAGWKRDFILHSVGWDKDADLNTVYGQTVDPLPFRGMRSYPFGPDEPVPASEAYLDYCDGIRRVRQNPAEFWRNCC